LKQHLFDNSEGFTISTSTLINSTHKKANLMNRLAFMLLKVSLFLLVG